MGKHQEKEILFASTLSSITKLKFIVKYLILFSFTVGRLHPLLLLYSINDLQPTLP